MEFIIGEDSITDDLHENVNIKVENGTIKPDPDLNGTSETSILDTEVSNFDFQETPIKQEAIFTENLPTPESSECFVEAEKTTNGELTPTVQQINETQNAETAPLLTCFLCPTKAYRGVFSFPKKREPRRDWMDFCSKFVPMKSIKPLVHKLCYKHFNRNNFIPVTQIPGNTNPTLQIWSSAVPSIHEEFDHILKQVIPWLLHRFNIHWIKVAKLS